MNKVLLVVALLAPFGASAAALSCSIHPKAGIADADLPALAKVTQAAAKWGPPAPSCSPRAGAVIGSLEHIDAMRAGQSGTQIRIDGSDD